MLDRQVKGQGDVFAVCLCAADRLTVFILYMQLTYNGETSHGVCKLNCNIFTHAYNLHRMPILIYSFLNSSDIKPLMDFTIKRGTKDCSELTLE